METNSISPAEMLEINNSIANAGSNPPPEVVINPFTRFVEGTTQYVGDVLDFALNPVSFALGKTGDLLGSTLEAVVKPADRFVRSIEPLTDSLAESAESLRLPLVLASIVLTAKGNPSLGIKLAKLATNDSYFRYDSKTGIVDKAIEKGKQALSGDASMADLLLNIQNHGMLDQLRTAIAKAKKMPLDSSDQDLGLKLEIPQSQPFTYSTSPPRGGRNARNRSKAE